MYEIILEALRSTNNQEKPNPGPHVDGMVGSVSSPTVESLVKRLHELSVKQSAVEATKASTLSLQSAIYFTQYFQKGDQ